MGRRTYIERVFWDARHPAGPGTVLLECGHTRAVGSSLFLSMGDPTWCHECPYGVCRGCGEPATTQRAPSYEWGESCEDCLQLPEWIWCRVVRERRLWLAQQEEPTHVCRLCGEPIRGDQASVLPRACQEDPEWRVHLICNWWHHDRALQAGAPVELRSETQAIRYPSRYELPLQPRHFLPEGP